MSDDPQAGAHGALGPPVGGPQQPACSRGCRGNEGTAGVQDGHCNHICGQIRRRPDKRALEAVRRNGLSESADAEWWGRCGHAFKIGDCHAAGVTLVKYQRVKSVCAGAEARAERLEKKCTVAEAGFRKVVPRLC